MILLVGVIGRMKGLVWIILFLIYFVLLFVQEHDIGRRPSCSVRERFVRG
jgi:hypothetical protein